MKKYFIKVEAYEKTESGKSWKSKPIRTERTEISEEEYNNIINSGSFFRGLGGTERITNGYTCEGYIPIRLTSISPNRETKIIRYFTPLR